MNMKRLLPALATALCLSGLLLLSRAGQLLAAPAPVRIAVIVPLSGPNASVGQQSVNAIRLAIEEINASGGIKALGGARLEPLIADSTNDPQGAVTTTQRVLAQHRVAAAFGLDLSPLTLAALPAFVKHHVPVVTAAISDTLLGAGNGGYLFQIAPRGTMFGKQEVRFLKFANERYHMGITKAAILYVNNPYGLSTYKGIEQLAVQAGLKIVFESSYPADITDASPLVTKVERSGAQALFPVSYITDAELLLTALHSAGSHILVVGGGAGFIWPPIGQALGERVTGLTSVASWNLNSKNVGVHPHLVGVTKRYARRWGTFMPEQAGEAYAAAFAIAAAIERARSSDSAKVREALAKLDLAGGGAAMMQPGRVAFDASGANKYAEPVMIQWQKGVPVTVFPESLASAPLLKP